MKQTFSRAIHSYQLDLSEKSCLAMESLQCVDIIISSLTIGFIAIDMYVLSGPDRRVWNPLHTKIQCSRFRCGVCFSWTISSYLGWPMTGQEPSISQYRRPWQVSCSRRCHVNCPRSRGFFVSNNSGRETFWPVVTKIAFWRFYWPEENLAKVWESTQVLSPAKLGRKTWSLPWKAGF